MKVTISRKYYRDSVTMEHTSDNLTLDQVIEILVRPALVAMGYPERSVGKALGPINYDALSFMVDDDEL